MNVLTKEIKERLKELRELDLDDIIEIPYSYLEHINSEYISGSYTININEYICMKQKELLDKYKLKSEESNDDFICISKNDWVYFLYGQQYDN